jgi:ABC-type dipeptide/oligopeptide/nickel transport system permease component
MSDLNSGRTDQQPGRMIGVGIAIGAGFGVALGLVLDSLALGIAIGVSLGVAIGAGMDQRRRGETIESGGRAIFLVGLAVGVALLGVLLFLFLRLR